MSAHDAIEAKYTEAARAIVVRDERPAAPPQLLDALRPAERVALLAEIASVVADVIEKQGWYKQIGPKKHILIQGWTFIGSLGGCSAKTVSTVAIEGGFKATASVVRVDSGVEVGSADQVCMTSESKWRGKDDYALIGMASTRACSRALSTVFRHVVELAGYSATPAEEMNVDTKPLDAAPPKPKPAPAKTTPTASPAMSDAARAAMVDRLARARDLGLIPAGSFGQGIVALKNWAGTVNVAWGAASVDAAIDAAEREASEKARREAQEAADAAFADVEPSDPENAPTAPETAFATAPDPEPPTTTGRLAQLAKEAARRGVVPYAPAGSPAHKAWMAAVSKRDAEIWEYLASEGDDEVPTTIDGRRHAFAARILGDRAKGSSQTWDAQEYRRVMDALKAITPAVTV